MCFANVLNELNTILLYYMSLVSHGYFISFHFFLTYVAISGMSREWLLGSGWYILGKKKSDISQQQFVYWKYFVLYNF